MFLYLAFSLVVFASRVSLIRACALLLNGEFLGVLLLSRTFVVLWVPSVHVCVLCLMQLMLPSLSVVNRMMCHYILSYDLIVLPRGFVGSFFRLSGEVCARR